MVKKDLIKSAGGVVVRKTKNGYLIALLYKNNDWVMPKGRVEPGEKQSQAALREIKEELGIPLFRLRVIKKLGILNYLAHQKDDNYRARPKVVTYFLIETSQKQIKPLIKDNFIACHWFKINEAFKKATYPESRGIILKAIKILSDSTTPIDTAVISVGGRGTRMKTNSCKLLFEFCDHPFLKHLLEWFVELKIKKCILLTGCYHREISRFIKQFYGQEKRIQIINGGKRGVPRALLKIKRLLKKSFIYLDGNIIFDLKPIKRTILNNKPGTSTIQLFISPKENAKTHLKINVSGNKIISFDEKISIFHKKLNSLGMMIIDKRIFEIFLDFNKFNDLDDIIRYIFKKRKDIDISFKEYTGDWFCLHDKKDIEILKKNEKFFNK